MSYFWDDPRKPRPGLKKDVERHRAKRDELDRRIEELEGQEQTPMTSAAVRTYRHLRAQLLQSLANVADRIGRKRT